jgi:hypothetical protein
VSAIERLRTIAAHEWRPVSTAGFLGFCAIAASVAWFAHTGQRWVPVLDSANLAFHEAGHPLFGIFSQRLMVYGGTLGQLAFPVAAAASFWLRREALSFAFSVAWLGENFWNISRYMADARARVLPLVGSGEHDWTEIFLRWGLLQSDTTVAALTRGLGWCLLAGVWGWLALRWLTERE